MDKILSLGVIQLNALHLNSSNEWETRTMAEAVGKRRVSAAASTAPLRPREIDWTRPTSEVGVHDIPLDSKMDDTSYREMSARFNKEYRHRQKRPFNESRVHISRHESR